MSSTDKYYEEHSNDFISTTEGCDMNYIYKVFLPYIKPHGRILDVGFGSGRDSLFFLKNSYDVYSLDSCNSFIEHGKRIGLTNLIEKNIEDIDYKDEFDGVFCCASLLHIELKKLPEVFKLLSKALKDEGAIYVSFKRGNFTGKRNGRYFTDLEKETLAGLLIGTDLHIDFSWYTNDQRPGNETTWLNAILKKSQA